MSQHPVEEIHWPVTAISGPECVSLEGDIQADVVVVGGGLTGCRTALGLAESGLSVVVLEEREIGWGASGRSGGQCNPIWRQTPEELIRRFGGARAEVLIKTTLESADELFRDIRHFGIECDDVQNGWVQAAHTTSSRSSLERLHAGWQAVGAKIDILEGSDVEKVSGSSEYPFALFHHKGGSVQPLSLTRGYARAAQARGARLYCGEAVNGLTKTGNSWRVATRKGSVSAAQVVLTTNAYSSDSLTPGIRQTFFPMVSIAVATEPLSAAQRATVLPNKVTISDTRKAIYFSRYDRDERLIFGCIGSSENVALLGGHQRLRSGINTVFPQLDGIGLERTWGGRIAVTQQLMPFIHEPAPGITAGLGFSGRGIAMTSVMGRALAAKVLGEPEHSLPFPVEPMRPIPFHAALNAVLPLGAPVLSLKDKIDKLISGL